MTQRVALPSEADVRAAIAELRRALGKEPPARSVAEKLGLARTTFSRHFPDIAQELADQGRAGRRAMPTSTTRPTKSDTALRSELAAARAQLELAVAHIQRLSIENHQLRGALKEASNVIPFPRRER